MMTRTMTMMALLAAGTTMTAHAETFAALEQAVPKTVDVLSIAPVFDFDGDSCLPSAGISQAGQRNRESTSANGASSGCRSLDFLASSNTVHRYACVTSGGSMYCGHFYALYFLEGTALPGVRSSGHPDWEYAAVWTKDGAVTHASVSARGGLTTVAASTVAFEGRHVKVVSHRDSSGTHSFGFARANHAAQNPYKRFVTPKIISWYEFRGGSAGMTNSVIRPLLNRFDYGSATLPTRDSEFVTALNRFKPEGYPAFTGASAVASAPANAGKRVTVRCRAGRRCGAQANVKRWATRSRSEPAKAIRH